MALPAANFEQAAHRQGQHLDVVRVRTACGDEIGHRNVPRIARVGETDSAVQLVVAKHAVILDEAFRKFGIGHLVGISQASMRTLPEDVRARRQSVREHEADLD